MQSHMSLIDQVVDNVKNNRKEEAISIESCAFRFQGVFALLKKIKATVGIINRFVCLIDNILERRALNWVESKYQEKGPKKLDQVFEDHLNKDVKEKPAPRGRQQESSSFEKTSDKYVPSVKKPKEEKVYKTVKEINEILKSLFGRLDVGEYPTEEGMEIYDVDSFLKDLEKHVF